MRYGKAAPRKSKSRKPFGGGSTAYKAGYQAALDAMKRSGGGGGRGGTRGRAGSAWNRKGGMWDGNASRSDYGDDFSHRGPLRIGWRA